VTTPRLFVSCYPYALIKGARVLGKLAPEQGAEAETALIKSEERRRDDSDWPCYRTVAQVEQLEPVMLVSDASGSIGQCRSRMSGRFLATSCDVWLTVDDDLFAEAAIIERVVSLARTNPSSVISAPYLLRDGITPSIGGLQSVKGDLQPVSTSGMGLVAMHRNALKRIEPQAQPAIDDKGNRYRAFWHEMIDEWCGWLGEDVSFCRRAWTAGVPILALADAPTCHAGRWSYMNPDGSFTVHRATPLGAAQAAQ
jgi:hypothetical protein